MISLSQIIADHMINMQMCRSALIPAFRTTSDRKTRVANVEVEPRFIYNNTLDNNIQRAILAADTDNRLLPDRWA